VFTAVAPPAPPIGSGWPQSLGTGTIADAIQTMPVTDGVSIYVGSNNGKFYALNPDGTPKWTVPFDAGASVLGTPVAGFEPNYIYVVTSGGRLLKVKDTGAAGSTASQDGGWIRDIGAVGSAQYVLTSSTNIYVGTSSNQMRKLRAGDGTDVWPAPPQLLGQVNGTVAVDETTPGVNELWVGDAGGGVSRIKTNDGTILSSFTSVGNVPINSDPLILAGYSYAPNNKDFLYITAGSRVYLRNRFNLKTSTDTWSDYDTGGAEITTSVEVDGFFEGSTPHLYFGTQDGRLIKLDGLTGSEIWSFQAPAAIESTPFFNEDDGYVYFGCNDGKVYAIRYSDKLQKPNWPYNAGAAVRSSLSMSSGNLLVGSDDGKLHVLDITP
ncbi:MAG TPA: PQQ-binding-like beta-propeller repeat protein, partial [Elusimicrobiota bacterium]|nr:PQQ-binding-like beta-propeller repeat protein [Elusimicrobiota bacterium]